MTVVGDVRVGLLGCGNVGAALARVVDEHADLITARAGARVVITRVAVRDVTRARDVKLPTSVFTDDAAGVVADPEVDIVVEVIGGVEPARALIEAALRAHKPVVTANKELIARDGPELFRIAAEHGVDLLFEASVAGGIPLLRPLRESLAGDRIRRVLGIVNGTTNYILTRMHAAWWVISGSRPSVASNVAWYGWLCTTTRASGRARWSSVCRKIAGLTSHDPSSTSPSALTRQRSDARTSSHHRPHGDAHRWSEPSTAIVTWPAMFSLKPIPARIRCRHASFWRSSSSTPSGGIARGFHVSTRAR